MKERIDFLELVAELRQCDHGFLTKEGVEHFTKPFGFEGSLYLARDARSEFKGLNLGEKHKEGDTALGQDAAQVAIEICQHLKINFPSLHGRGSQLQVCCDAIEQHFGVYPIPPYVKVPPKEK